MADTPQDHERDGPILEGQAETVDISEPEAPRPRPPWKRWRFWAWAAPIVVVAGGAGFTYWQPELVLRTLGLPTGAPTERLAKLESSDAALRDEIETLKRRLKIMEVRLNQIGDTEALARRVAALEKARAEAREKVAQAVPETPPERPAAQAPSADALAVMEERLAKLEEALKAARTVTAEADERAIRKAEEAAAKAAALRAELAARDRRIDTLAKENSDLNQAVTGMAGRLVAVEKVSSLSGRSAALVLAAGQLREALTQSAPFGPALDRLRAIAGEDPTAAETVAVLAPHAAAGIPTLPALAASFDPVARKVVQAAVAKEDPGWIDRALARLSGLVTIRPTGGDVAGDAPTAILARGEARLKAGDLDGAVKELSALAGAPGKAIAPWLDRAKARLAADEAVAALNRAVIGRIAGALPAPPTAANGQPAPAPAAPAPAPPSPAPAGQTPASAPESAK